MRQGQVQSSTGETHIKHPVLTNNVQSSGNVLRVVVAPFCKRQARQLHPFRKAQGLYTVLNRLQTITTTTAFIMLPTLWGHVGIA